MAGTFLFSAAICVLMPHGNIDHFAHVGGVLGGFVCYAILTPNHQIPLRLPQDPNPHPHIVRHGSIDSKHFRRSQLTNAPPPLFEPHHIAKLILGTVLLVVMMRFVEQADWIADINIISIGHFFQTAEGDGTDLFGSAIVGMAMMRSKPVIRRKTRWHLEPLRSKMQAAITAVRRDGVVNSVAAKEYDIPARTLRRQAHACVDAFVHIVGAIVLNMDTVCTRGPPNFICFVGSLTDTSRLPAMPPARITRSTTLLTRAKHGQRRLSGVVCAIRCTGGLAHLLRWSVFAGNPSPLQCRPCSCPVRMSLGEGISCFF